MQVWGQFEKSNPSADSLETAVTHIWFCIQHSYFLNNFAVGLWVLISSDAILTLFPVDCRPYDLMKGGFYCSCTIDLGTVATANNQLIMLCVTWRINISFAVKT